jgi:hypothetical protein
MADLNALIGEMIADGRFRDLATNRAAQFGRPTRRYLGATLLPERTVTQNMFREWNVRYRTVIANDGTRFSPVQLKGNAITGSMLVELAHQDIGNELTGPDYDALIELLQQNITMEAAAQIINFADTMLNLPLVEKTEKQRWEAIVDASVPLTGDNGYSETVSYPNPSGHRAAASDSWSDDTHDPFDDIATMADLLQGKGYTVGRMITSRPVLSILANNALVKARAGLGVVNVGGTLTVAQQRATQAAINEALDRDGLPAIETYDLQYRTQTGTGYFLKRDVFVMVAETGRDMEIDLGDEEPVLMPNTLGYAAIGRATGQATPGRVIRVEPKMDKPPRVQGEAWQTSLPVLQDPEAVAVITDID